VVAYSGGGMCVEQGDLAKKSKKDVGGGGGNVSREMEGGGDQE
jgi:hypothetical protein